MRSVHYSLVSTLTIEDAITLMGPVRASEAVAAGTNPAARAEPTDQQRIRHRYQRRILAATTCQVIPNPPVNLVDGRKEQPLCAVASSH
jgi:hypothetical protein